MFGFGEDKKKKKAKKPSNVFRKCKTEGYIEVYHEYLLELVKEMESKSTLRDRSPGGVTKSRSSSVQMLDSLLCWMFQRKKPFWMLGTNENEWKRWVVLKKNHWIIDEKIRAELIREKMI